MDGGAVWGRRQEPSYQEPQKFTANPTEITG